MIIGGYAAQMHGATKPTTDSGDQRPLRQRRAAAALDLQQLLRLRRAELDQQIRADTDRLAEVERRLRSIERGLTMSNDTFQMKTLPMLRLAQMATVVNDTTEIGSVVGGLQQQLAQRLNAAGISAEGSVVRTGGPDGG